MSLKRYKSGNYSGQLVDWYWEKGLHDAKIISTEFSDLDYDYALRNPKRNAFTVTIDSTGALFDTSIKKIVFYNCKLLAPDIKLDGSWWLQDILTKENNKYVLTLTAATRKKEYVFRIMFDYADVIRE